MNKTTFTVSGEAMSKIDRAAVMKAAWACFRGSYGPLAHPFRERSRKRDFGRCLSMAWEDARRAQRRAAMTDTQRRIADLHAEIDFAHTSENWAGAKHTIAACMSQIAQLSQQVENRADV